MQNALPAAEAAPQTSPTLNAIMDAYQKDRDNPMAHKPCLHPGGIRSHLKAPRAAFGHLTAKEFYDDTEQYVEDACLEWFDAGLSKATVTKRLTLLKSAFKHAVRRKMIKRDDEPFIITPGQGEPRERFIDREKEWPLLLEAMDAPETPDHIRLFVKVQLGGMQRCGATLGLKWDMVDFDANTIWYKRTGGAKNKRRVNIPMSAGLREALQIAKRRAQSDYVIEWRGERVRNVYQGFQALVERAGLVDVRIHDLRRTAATWAFMDRVPLDIVAAMLGDNPDMCRKHYAQVLPGYLDEAANSLDRTMRATLASYGV